MDISTVFYLESNSPWLLINWLKLVSTLFRFCRDVRGVFYAANIGKYLPVPNWSPTHVPMYILVGGKMLPPPPHTPLFNLGISTGD